MAKIFEYGKRLRSFFRQSRIDRELEEELHFHLEMKKQDNLAAGMTADEAQFAANRQFGNITRLKEMSREAWTLTFLETLLQDLRFGLRSLWKSPGFTLAAVLILALGIGANTAIFSIIDALMLRMLPVGHPEQLYILRDAPVASGLEDSLTNGQNLTFTYHEYELIRDHQDVFSGLLAYRIINERISALFQGHTEMTTGQIVSGNYFSLLGVSTSIGRVITEGDDRSGSEPVIVISYGLWQRRFGGDPSVLGKTLTLNNTPFTIIGVTPSDFFGLEPGDSPDITIPMAARERVVLGRNLNSDSFTFAQLVGRLSPERTEAQARANLAVNFHDILEQRVAHNSDASSPEKRKELLERKLELVPGARGYSWFREQLAKPLFIILVIVGVVLALSCTNTAVMLLARHARREKEIAIRLALGAGRVRLIVQLLTESLMLTCMGGICGSFLAYIGTSFLLSKLVIGPNPISLSIGPDRRVLLFTSSVAIFSGLICGLVSAKRATRLNLMDALKNNGA